MESVAAFAWNRWQACYGISGSFRVERVAALPWNQWQDSPGISGSFGVEYAHQHEKEADVLPEKCIKLKEQYKEDNDPFSDFVEDCLTVKEDGFVLTEDLNNALSTWGQQHRAPALMSVGKQAIEQLFRTCGLTPGVKKGRKLIDDQYRRGYVGVELNNSSVVQSIARGGNARATLSSRLQSRY